MRKKIKPRNIKDYDKKLEKIKKLLHTVKKPLKMNDIATRTGIRKDELETIVYVELKKAHKDTRKTGYGTDDFLLFGDNIEEIQNNRWYNMTLHMIEQRSNMMDKIMRVR